ncbi:RNA polymerase sigma-70 factor [Parabacteroides sp. PF5-6]|uniref:RNA polymerase sigma-70 factor n=1 Tax=Parabacteroides sp. PF5-6 TaxID=1742403 RepID=UPI002406E4AF|nr:RNA polymerase sigma-70 factor [Parabacteroides sp. PF5-6]MDF9830118.1 RNA polymerase sigma-70 factor (ECF subfamily) [Parabacteroides sp. PF5-6]
MDNEHGEVRTFSSLFERFRKPYIRFIYSYVKDMDEAEDIYMDTMMRFWENRKELPGNTHIPSYLLAAVKNRALNALRQQSVRNDAGQFISEHQSRELNFRISTLEACEPSELFTDEIRRIIDYTLRDLPEHTRMIFYMSRYENKTNKEIAQELNINIKTVEYHITKTLKVLRANLKDYLPFLLLGFPMA